MEHHTVDQIKEELSAIGITANVEIVNKPTFYALHHGILENFSKPDVPVAVFESDSGMVSMVQGEFHLTIWGGLPGIGLKKHTVRWSGASEYIFIDELIASLV